MSILVIFLDTELVFELLIRKLMPRLNRSDEVLRVSAFLGSCGASFLSQSRDAMSSSSLGAAVLNLYDARHFLSCLFCRLLVSLISTVFVELRRVLFALKQTITPFWFRLLFVVVAKIIYIYIYIYYQLNVNCLCSYFYKQFKFAEIVQFDSNNLMEKKLIEIQLI